MTTTQSLIVLLAASALFIVILVWRLRNAGRNDPEPFTAPANDAITLPPLSAASAPSVPQPLDRDRDREADRQEIPPDKRASLSLEVDGQLQSVTVTHSPFILGRQMENFRQQPDLAVTTTDRWVSKRHCAIEYSDQGYYLRDLSKNYTTVNESMVRILREDGQLLRDTVRLVDSDIIDIHDIQIKFRHQGSMEAFPTLIGYQIDEILGKGGMAIVYRGTATDGLHVRQREAVKVPNPLPGEKLGETNDRISSEFRVMQGVSAIGGEEVIRVTRFGYTNDGRAFFAMEMLNGITLAKTIKSYKDRGQAIDEATALQILVSFATSLRTAHQAGFVHCDVKPANISFLTMGAMRPGQPVNMKLFDFGIAKPMFHTEKNKYGTANYQAPEHIQGGKLTDRTDVYSLGCVAFELVTSSKVFAGEDGGQGTKQAHVSKEPPPVDQRAALVNNPVSRSYHDLVHSMLAKSPDYRPTTDEIIERSRTILAGVA